MRKNLWLEVINIITRLMYNDMIGYIDWLLGSSVDDNGVIGVGGSSHYHDIPN